MYYPFGTTLPQPTPLPVFNVMVFGATGNGSTDDTVAIQSAINACIAAGGGIVFCPAGTYHITSTLTFSGGFQANLSFIFMGAGGEATTILQSNLSADVFASNPYPSGSPINSAAFRDFSVDFSGTPTGGYVFHFPWIGSTEITMIFVKRCWGFVFLGQTATVVTVDAIFIHRNNVQNVFGTCFGFNGKCQNVYLEDMELIGVGNTTSCTCLMLNDGYMDTFWMRGLDFEAFGNGLNFSANGANQCGLADAYIQDVIVDAPNNYGLAIGSSSTTGTFSRIKFRNLWITTSGSGAPGLAIGINSGAALEDLTFTGCNFSGTNFAVSLEGQAGNIISDVAFEFCQLYLSPVAIALQYTNNISFLNCSIGTPYGGGAGQVLQVNSTNTGLLFQGNRVTGYSGFFGGGGLSSVGSGSLIANNLGVNPYGALTAPTYTAGSPATNTFPFNVRVSVTGASAVAINGTSTGGAAGAYILLPGETITPTGAGSWTWFAL